MKTMRTGFFRGWASQQSLRGGIRCLLVDIIPVILLLLLMACGMAVVASSLEQPDSNLQARSKATV